MVFQSYALYPRMTVRDNMSFGLQGRGHAAGRRSSAASRRRREMLQITELLDRRPSELSGGQRQRVAIGRALVRDVDVFLFDEPLSNLDAQLRAELRVEIKRLHQRLKATMIYVTHDQIEALTLADRIAVMKDRSHPAARHAAARSIERPANRFVACFVGSPAMNFVAGRLRRDGGPTFAAGDFELPLRGYPFAAAPRDRRRSSSASGPSISQARGRRPRAADRDGRADGQRRAGLEPARRHAALAAPAGGETAPRVGDQRRGRDPVGEQSTCSTSSGQRL